MGIIDILFGDSACGSLKMAQNFGEGEYNSRLDDMVITHLGDGEPDEEEIKAALQEFELHERRMWEKATPLGGNPDDVYGFYLALGVGDISESRHGPLRQNVISKLFSVYPEGEIAAQDLEHSIDDTLDAIAGRIQAGDSIRLWYSDQPDEMCGLYWFMDWLTTSEEACGQIFLVKLPACEACDSETTYKTSWGDVEPWEWHQYFDLQEAVPQSFRESCAGHWRKLKLESVPLRVVQNGQPISAEESFYDEYIYREIDEEDDEFHEAMIVGRVLGKYRLGISDAFIALRIEEMIQAGELAPISSAAKDSPIYHRMLKKCGKRQKNL